MKFDPNRIRTNFPVWDQEQDPAFVYLDNAATTQKPTAMVNAVRNFYIYNSANVGRGLYNLAEQATVAYEAARKEVAQFIGASPKELLFTFGTTDGINSVASWVSGWLKPTDEIVISELEHHSNLVPWQQVAQKIGARVRYIPVDDDGMLQYEQLDAIITDKTKFVSISHVSNAIGVHNNLDLIIQRARSVGAYVLIDAAQSVPHQPINVRRLDCDFLAFSAHKMLGPTGIGALYVREELQDSLIPSRFGGGMVFEVSMNGATWVNGPQKFEAGTPPIVQAIGFGAAVQFLRSINFDDLKQHEASLCARFIDFLEQKKGVRILGPKKELKKKGHLVSFVINNVHAHDVAAYLNQKNICVRAGHHCAQPLADRLGYDASIRVSFYCYNRVEDVDRLCEVLDTLITKQGY